MFYFLLKWILVLALLVGGAFFIATGIGAEISLVKYKGLEAHGVPAGILSLVIGVALAALWKISTTTTTETETCTERSNDDKSTKVTIKVTETRAVSMRKPLSALEKQSELKVKFQSKRSSK